MKPPVVLLLGKIPPPYMGPSIATRILLDSSLKDRCRLIHLDTRAHQSLDSMGRFGISKLFRTWWIYSRMKLLILRYWPSLVIIPVSQSTMGFFKDSWYLIIAKLFFRKAVFHLRGSNFRNWYESAPSIFKVYVRIMLSWCDGVIVQGERLRPIFRGLVPDHRIHVVPNGGNYPFQRKNGVHSPFRWLYLANLQASKGIQDVLAAVNELKKQGKVDFVLEVVGSWRSEETKRTCLQLVEEQRLPVEFRPAAGGDEKWEAFRRADGFLFTPREPEGHPWVIVEAQAASLPIIATDQGAIAEAVTDGVNGFIVPVNAPLDIAERMKRLMNSPELHAEMSEKSRATYESKYTEERMVDNMMNAITAFTA